MCADDLAKQLVPVRAGFPTAFLGKLAWKVANGYHMTTGPVSGPKCEPVGKSSDCDHMTTGMLGCDITL